MSFFLCEDNKLLSFTKTIFTKHECMIQPTLETLWGNSSRENCFSYKSFLQKPSVAHYPFHSYCRDCSFTYTGYREEVFRISNGFKKENAFLVVTREQHLNESMPVDDFIFDSQNDFTIVSQRSVLRLFSVDELCRGTEGINDILSLQFNRMTNRIRINQGASLNCGFSCAKFLGNSLHIISGYRRGSFIDIFDLEEVDEEECKPNHSFNLIDLPSQDMYNYATESLYACDISDTIMGSISIAGLSNGKTATIDPRINNPLLCTGIPTSSYTLGQRRSDYMSPITAVFCVNQGTQLLSGSRDGKLFLWDLRNPKNPLFLKSLGGEINKICESPNGINTTGCRRFVTSAITGSVNECGLGETSFEILCTYSSSDIARNAETIAIPSPKVSVNNSNGIIIVPNISNNAINFLHIKSSRHADRFPLEASGCDFLDEEQVSNTRRTYDVINTLNIGELNFQISSAQWLQNTDQVLLGSSDGQVYVLDIRPYPV